MFVNFYFNNNKRHSSLDLFQYKSRLELDYKMFEFRNKKVVLVCPECGKDEFQESEPAGVTTMKHVGKMR